MSASRYPAASRGAARATSTSVTIGAIAALALGAAIGFMPGRNVAGTAVRPLAVAAVAAAVTYGVGSMLGVSAT